MIKNEEIVSQILLLEDDQALSTILRLNLTKTLGSDVLLKNSSTDAIALLELLGDLNMIITREVIASDPIALNLRKYIEVNNLDIPLLVFGKNVSSFENSVEVSSTQDWKDIIISAGTLLGKTINIENQETTNYVAVDINYFLNITSSSMGCDVYIRVKKGDEFQYIKRLHSTDHFQRDDIAKYIATGLKEFFISKEHYPDFVNYVTTQLSQKLDDKNISGSERIQLNSESFEVTLDRISNLDIDPFTMDLVDESIKSMQSSIKESSALGAFLSQLNTHKLSYAYSHCYFTCLILHQIIKQFNWGTDVIKEKITYLAYFHDISLKDDKLLKIHSTEEIKKNQLTKEEVDLVLNHAALSADILEKFSNVPFDVGVIIREHHGVKTGKGFAETRSISISPLAMMFIVVEDFATSFLEISGTPTNAQLENILNNLAAVYTKVTYAQTVEALRALIIPAKK